MKGRERREPEKVLRPVRVLDNVWIPLSDGCRLAAKIWMPEDAGENPVPAVLEYIPYRKRDLKAIRDSEIHGYFAAHGYAGVRVDLRGSGDSEGILRDEYLQQELDDGLEVLRWIAAQPWCDGGVGMFGLSWGGFNGLQIAALQPPELKAIITVCSSDDRYADDIHYMGGCLLTDNLSWASTMFAFNSCPPDPEVVGERWRDMWLERLQGSGLWLRTWLEHQRRDDYWRHGSVCEDYGRIRCPVFAVSGWADGYTNTVFHLMEHLRVPRRGLVGPWGHKYPHMGGPGPTIGFLQESLRWWDQWLKGIDRGLEKEPVICAWMQDAYEPTAPARPGRWVVEERWPGEGVLRERYRLTPSGLSNGDNGRGDRNADPEESFFEVQSPLSVGLFAGKWCSYAEATDLPSDQRDEDGGALVFDSAPLAEPLEILGAPEVTLSVASDKPVAQVAVRLSDVAPDNTVTRVTYGLFNLTHRDSHAQPRDLEPGKQYTVTFPLNYIAQRFPAGHRLRVAISSSYWPLAWPAPEAPRLTIYTAGSEIIIPRRLVRRDDAAPPRFAQPESAQSIPFTLLAPAHREWTVVHNLRSNEVALDVVNNDAVIRLEDINLTVRKDVEERFSYRNNRYDTLRAEVTGTRAFQRGAWEARTITRTVLTSTRTHFRIRATLDAYEGDARIFARSWDEIVPRDGL
ncbi:MAG: CocE/NonD family hydrolase [Spirochaetaceae bacterium]|nr:MAG: CocE/NonD family hydrolase [Spirochaetaceae bacterium]